MAVLAIAIPKLWRRYNFPAESVPPQSVLEKSVAPDCMLAKSVPPQSVLAKSVPPQSVSAKSVSAESFVPESVSAESVLAKSVLAKSVLAENVSAESVSAENVSAENVSAESVSAESFVPESFVPESFVPESFVPESFPPESTEQGPYSINDVVDSIQQLSLVEYKDQCDKISKPYFYLLLYNLYSIFHIFSSANDLFFRPGTSLDIISPTATKDQTFALIDAYSAALFDISKTNTDGSVLSWCDPWLNDIVYTLAIAVFKTAKPFIELFYFARLSEEEKNKMDLAAYNSQLAALKSKIEEIRKENMVVIDALKVRLSKTGDGQLHDTCVSLLTHKDSSQFLEKQLTILKSYYYTYAYTQTMEIKMLFISIAHQIASAENLDLGNDHRT